MKTLTTSALRDAGHPWTGEKGWDLLLMQTAGRDEMQLAIAGAERGGWSLWTAGETQAEDGSCVEWRCVLFKPSGRSGSWIDPMPWPEAPKVTNEQTK